MSEEKPITRKIRVQFPLPKTDNIIKQTIYCKW